MAKSLTLKAILALDAKQFQQGMGKIQQQIGSIGNAMKQAFAVGSVAMLGKSILMATKNYEDAMARVKAVSNASQIQMKMMNDEALRLGATTRYTATQVAETLEVLTRNGFSAEKATKSLAATLQLAQANAVGLADAGNMITNTLNMFGLSVNEVQRVNDVMSSIASNTATNLQDFYDALVNAAPMAHALGISIEETAAALGSLAQRGIKGADAGTQLRMALQKMVDPSSMKKLKALGIEIDEEIIKAEGLQGVLEKLNAANLSVSQLNEIFTVRSSKSILQLVRAVDDFNAILEITKNSSGTAMRMFEEGVGSVRKELDVLKSVWENLMITIGNSTKGPINATIRGLQNTITAFKTWGGAITNIVTILGIALTGKLPQIQQFFKTLSLLFKKNSIQAQLNAAETELANDQAIASDKKRTAEEIKNAKLRIAARNKEITAMKAQISAANALKATLKAVASATAWMAILVVIQQLVVKLIAMGQALRDAQKAVADAANDTVKLNTKLNLLKNMIGDGSDKTSLAGAVKEAMSMFSEFSEVIKLAYIEAGKTGNYEKLKKVLTDIADLQSTIMASKANQELMEATQDAFARTLRTRDDKTSRQIRGGLKDQGYDSKGIDAVIKYIGGLLISNNKDLNKATKAVQNYLKDFDINIDYDQLHKWVKEVTPKEVSGFWTPLTGKRQASPWAAASSSYNRQQELIEKQGKQENQLKWNSAFDTYNMRVGEAAKNFLFGSKEYNEAITDAAAELKNAVGDIVDELDWSARNEYYDIQRKYGKENKPTSASIGDAGKESKKKTEWDKFTDTLDDYTKETKKLEEQRKKDVITQEEYDAAMVKLNRDTWLVVAAMEDLDKKLSKLSKTQKEALQKVQENGLNAEQGKSLQDLTDTLLKYSNERSEINERRNNGEYQNDSEYFEALKKLEDQTWESISGLKELATVIGYLSPAFKTLYLALQKSVKANKDAAKKLNEIEINSYFPTPMFTGYSQENREEKTDDFNKLRDILTNYLKKRTTIETQLDKGTISTEEAQYQLDNLEKQTLSACLWLKHFNEVGLKMPQAYQDAIKKLKDSNPNDTQYLADSQTFNQIISAYYKKALDIWTRRLNKSLDDQGYNEEMGELVQTTALAVSKIKSLDTIVENLNPTTNKMYKHLQRANANLDQFGKALKDVPKVELPKSTEQIHEDAQPIEINPTINVENTIDNSDEYKRVNDLITKYLSERAKIDEDVKKKALSVEDAQAKLDSLNTYMLRVLLGFENLDSVIPKLSKQYQKAVSDLKSTNPNDTEYLDEKSSFSDVIQNYYEEALGLWEQKLNGTLDDNEYDKRMVELVGCTVGVIAQYKNLDKIVTTLNPQLLKMYEDLLLAQEGLRGLKLWADSQKDIELPQPKETTGETVNNIDVKPDVNVDVTVNVDGAEVGKSITVTATTESQPQNKDNTDEVIKKLTKLLEDLKRVQNPKEYDREKQVSDMEIDYELKLKNVDNLERQIQDLMDLLNSGTLDAAGIAVATQKMKELYDALKKARDEAQTLKLKIDISNEMNKVAQATEDFKKSALDNVSNVASAFDRLMDAIQSISSAFGEELEWEGLKKVMSVVNGTIQMLEALKTIITTVKAVEEAATRSKVQNAAKEVMANYQVAASEGVKATAEAGEAVAGGASSVASVPYVGPALAIAAIAAITAALLAGMNRFADGGIVQGSTKGDKHLVRTDGSEMILNRKQQGNLFAMIANGGSRGGQVEFIIRGENLWGTLKNYDRKWHINK